MKTCPKRGIQKNISLPQSTSLVKHTGGAGTINYKSLVLWMQHFHPSLPCLLSPCNSASLNNVIPSRWKEMSPCVCVDFLASEVMCCLDYEYPSSPTWVLKSCAWSSWGPAICVCSCNRDCHKFIIFLSSCQTGQLSGRLIFHRGEMLRTIGLFLLPVLRGMETVCRKKEKGEIFALMWN